MQFTANNTEGFTAAELATLNAAFEILTAGFDTDDADNRDYVTAIADRINNAWVPGITLEALVANAWVPGITLEALVAKARA